ncbi:MAG: TIM barrel protein [Chloroflexi bacterium]|jgi:inosose dehydratase|nr:TIM barrel protein [Chloroflexota bacterium]
MSNSADLINARAHGEHGPRIAAAPITWGVCEIPGWGEVPGVDHVLDEIAELGFTGTELGPDGYLPLDPGELRHALGSRGLSLVGAFCPLNYRDPGAFVASHEFGVALAHRLAAVGCHTLVAADAGDARRSAIAGRVTGADGLSPDMWARYGEGLADLARAIAPLGVRVAFHPHAATYVETEAEIDAVMANTPADLVGLCLDTGHVAYGGGDPVALARRHAGRVWHVHVKDVSAAVLAQVRAEGLAYPDAIGAGGFVPVGDGLVDFPALVAELRRAGFDGWYVLEQDVRLGPPWPEQSPRENAVRSREYLLRQLGSGA